MEPSIRRAELQTALQSTAAIKDTRCLDHQLASVSTLAAGHTVHLRALQTLALLLLLHHCTEPSTQQQPRLETLLDILAMLVSRFDCLSLYTILTLGFVVVRWLEAQHQCVNQLVHF